MSILKALRRSRRVLGGLMFGATLTWSTLGYAETLYKSNPDNTALDSATTTLFNVNVNFSEGVGTTASDIIAFNNFITAARNFDISKTTGVNLGVQGLLMLNPGGAIAIRNETNQSQTLTIGAGGIDMTNATQNLTLTSDTGGTLTVATSANQTWTVRNQRTLTISTALTLANDVNLGFSGGTQGGTAGIATLSGAISGAGNLNVTGMVGGAPGIGVGGTVNISGNNTAWTGALTVGGGANVNIDTGTTGGQSRLADSQVVTLNRGSLTLSNNAATQVETIGGLSLGQGLNQVLRSSTSTTTRLNVNAATITHGIGAALNVGNIGTNAATSHLIIDQTNTSNGLLGAWAVAINGTTDTNWIKNGPNTADGGVIALSGADYTTENNLNNWTNPAQNILINGATTVGAASQTISTLKIAHATATSAVTVDIGAGNTLTLDDQANGGGIIRNQNGATTIGNATVGSNSLTAGTSNDGNNDTLYFWNSQNTMIVNSLIVDNGNPLHVFSGGAGTVTVRANNTFTGGVTIGAGTLAIGDNSSGSNDASLGSGDIVNHGTLVLSKQTTATLAQMTIANNISGSGTFTINRGTAMLSGNNTYQGDTNVSASTTLLAGSTTGLSADSRILLNAASSILNLNGFDSTIAAVRGDQTTANIELGANTLTFSGSNKARPGANDLVFDLSTQNYQGGISGAGNIIKNGLYTQVFTAGGAATYAGTTTVNNGVLQTNKTLATSALTVAGGSFISNIADALPDTAAVNVSGQTATYQINAGFSDTIGSLAGVTNSRVTLGDAATVLTIADNGGAPTSFNGVISGPGGVTYNGANTWILGGGNSYTGPTVISQGIIQLGNATPHQKISDVSAVTVATGATLDLNNASESIGSLSGGGSVLMGAGSLTIGRNQSSTNFSGSISGSGGLTKVGDGTQTLSGGNTFAGPLKVARGTLVLNDTVGGNAIADTVDVTVSGRGATLSVATNETINLLNLANGALLDLGVGAALVTTNTGAVSLNGRVTGAGGFTKNGAGTLTITGTLGNSGATVIGGGTVNSGDISRATSNNLGDDSILTMAAGTTLNFVNTTVNIRTFERVGGLSGAGGTINLFNGVNSSVLVAGNGADTSWAGVLAGNNGETGFMKDGAGVLTLTGSHTYDGVFRVNAGEVVMSGTGRLDDANFIIMNNGNAKVTYSIGSATDTIAYLAGGGRVTGLVPFSVGGTANTSSMGGNVIGGTGGEVSVGAGSILRVNGTTTPRVFGGSLTGAGTFQKSNTALMDLWGANTIASVIIDGGTLRTAAFGAAAGLGAPSSGGWGSFANTTNISMAGGTLDFAGSTQTLNSLFTTAGAPVVTLGRGTLNINTTVGNSGTFQGVITGVGDAVLNVNATGGASGWTFSGTNGLSVPRTVIANGATVTLGHTTNAVADTARITVNGSLVFGSTQASETVGSIDGASTGVIDLGASHRLTLSAGTGATFAGVISGTGTSGLTLSGLGSLVLSGTNTYTGETAVNNRGVLTLSLGGTGTVLNDAGMLTLGGGTVRTRGSVTENVGGLTLNRGSNWLGREESSNLSMINVGAITRNAESALVVRNNSVVTSSTNTNNILGGYAVIGGSYITATDWAVGNGAAAIGALAPGSYTNNVWGANIHTNVTASFNASGNTDTLRFNSAGAFTVTLTNPAIVDQGGILVTPNVGANNVTIKDNGSFETLTGGTAGAVVDELIIHQYNQRGSLIIDAAIGDNAGPTDLIKTGPGKLILAQDTSFSGSTLILGGTLQLGNGGSAGDISGNPLTPILNEGVLAFNRNDTLLTLINDISGSGSIQQIGTGKTTLGGNSTFTGRVSVVSGTLTTMHAQALGSTADYTAVNTGATLELDGVTTAESVVLEGGKLSALNADSTVSGVLGVTRNSVIDVEALRTLSLTGPILGVTGVDLTFQGDGTTLLTNTAAAFDQSTIAAGHTVRLGNNTANGNLGSGDIINDGSLILDRSNSNLYLGNNLSGNGVIRQNRNVTAWLAGELSGFTGNIEVQPTGGTIYLGDHDMLANANLSMDVITTNATNASSSVRVSIGNPLVNWSGDVTLNALNGGTANLVSVFAKNGLGMMNFTGRIGGELASGSADDRSRLEISSGVLRIVSDAATGKGLMGITAGAPDPSLAFGGEILLNSFNTLHWGYLELAGDRDQTINATITGGGSIDQGGIFVHNTDATTILNPTGLSTSNTLFNSRHQVNRGTLVLQGGNAWRNDAPIGFAPGTTLRIDNAEIASVGMMRGSTLVLNDTLTNAALNDRDFFLGAYITGTGGLVKTGSGGTARAMRLYDNTSDFTGNVTLNHGVIQATSLANAGVASSLGAGNTVTIDTLAANDNIDTLVQFVSLNTANMSTDRTLVITGTGTGNTTIRRGIANYGAGSIDWAGPVNILVAQYPLYLRGSQTGTHALMAPFGGWTSQGNVVSGLISGPGGIVKDDASEWTLTNAGNTFTGSITINNGRLETPNIGSLGVGPKTINLGSGANTPHLVFNSSFTGGTLGLDMNLSGTTGNIRIVNLGTGPLTLSDATWAASGAGAKTLTLGRFDDASGYVNVVSGAIVNNSGTNTTALAKDGQSTWRLDGVNTFTGAVTVNNGVLQLANASGTTLATGVDVTVANAFGRGSTLELLTNESIDGLTGGIGATVELNANNLTVGESNTATTFNGVMRGTGNLIKTGTAVLTMGAASSNLGITQLGQNTFTGTTTISGGRIDTSTLVDGGLPSGVGASSNAAANLRLAGANNVSDIGLRYLGTEPATTDRLFSIAPSDSVTRTNNGIWADPAVSLGINNDAVLNFTNTGPIGFTTANSASTLTLRGSNLLDHTFAPLLQNNGTAALSLNKIEASTWVVTNANTYTGTTTISGGTLVITNNSALGTSAGGTNVTAGGVGLEMRNNITVTGETFTNTGDGGFLGSALGSNVWTGTVQMNQNTRVYAGEGDALTLSGVVASDTNLRTLSKLDSGLVIMSGANTYSGPTALLGGTLQLNFQSQDNSKLSNSTALTFGGTGLLTIGSQDNNNLLVSKQVWQQGGTLELVGGTHAEVVSATTLNNGASRIIRSSGSATINLNAITRNVGSVLDIGTASIATTDTNNVNGILGGYATINRTDWAASVVSGAADTPITALATYAVADTYAAGSNSDVVAFTAPGAPIITNSIRFHQAAGGTLTLTAGNNDLQSGGILVTPNSGAVTIDGGSSAVLRHATPATAANSHDLIIHQHSSSPMTIDVQIGENLSTPSAFTQGLTKAGAGTLILTQDNTFRGTINLAEGTLQIGNGGALGSLGTGGSTFNPVIFGKGATLILNTTKATEYNFQTISGEGNLILAATNTQPFMLDDDNNNFIGTITVSGGTLRVRGNNNALGNVRDSVVVNGGGILEANGATQTFANLITYNDGAVLAAAPNGGTNTAATFSGRQFLNNTTSAGMTFTASVNQLLTVSGVISGNNGFTKTGNGTVAISGQNIFDAQGTLKGQVVVAGGVLNLGNARTLGETGAGHETIVMPGASLDLRDQDINFGDEQRAMREIIQISGNGYLGTGALRNTTGAGTFSHLELLADAAVGSSISTSTTAGIAGTQLDLAGFDTDVTPGVSYTLPTLNGGGFALTKVGAGDFRLFETQISNLSKFIVAEGEARAETRSQYPFANNVATTNPTGIGGLPVPLNLYPHTLFTTANVANGIEIVYNGQTTDPNNTALLNPVVGARLDLFRQHGAHHTANIVAFGRSAVSGGSIDTASYLELSADTLPKVYTYWDGNINLTGLANGSNTFFNIEGGGAGTGVGNTILGTQNPGGDQVVNPQSILFVRGQITGAGGITKIGSRELRLTNNNTFTGDFVTNRNAGTNQPIDPNQAGEARSDWWGVTLYGQGRLSGASNVVLERAGLLRVDNTNALDAAAGINGVATNDLGANLGDRINDTAGIKMRAGYLIFDSGNSAVTETLGTVTTEVGNNYLVINGTNNANVNTTITLAGLQRQAGTVMNLTSWDSTAVFGTTAPAGQDSVRIQLLSTVGLNLVGSGAGMTDKKIAVGVFGGLAALPHDDPSIWLNGQDSVQKRNLLLYSPRDFMTYDNGYLRPLDDSEYYTDNINIAGAAGRNLNLSENYTVLTQNLTVNSLRLGNLNDNLGNNASTVAGSSMTELQDTVVLFRMNDRTTLNIASGMLLSASFGQGVNQDMQTFIEGGTIDFGANEGIIRNVNGWYAETNGSITGNSLFIRSTITNSVTPGNIAITKTGVQQVVLDGSNTYSGLTKITEGNLHVRNGMSLGVGGVGNGVVIEGSGSMNLGSGVNVGSVIGNASLDVNQENIYVGILAGDQTILSSNDSFNRYYGNITIDNVDNGGQALFRPRLTVGANTGLVLAGNIGGGNTPISNDIYYINPRHLSTEGSSNGYMLIKGTLGDKLDGLGNAVSVANPVYNLPTGTLVGGNPVTNENEVFTFYVGNNDELNVMMFNPSKAVGRTEVMRGYLRYVGSGDYYDPATLALINSSQAANAFVGLQIGGSLYNNSPGDNTMAAFLLTAPGQSFGVNNWTITTHANANNGAVMFGSEAESGSVRFGPATTTTNSTITLARDARIYANAGGTVDIFSRFLAGSISKIGRGTVNLFGSNSGDFTTGTWLVSGGEIVLDYTGINNRRSADAGTLNFNGGTMRLITNAAANTTQAMSNTNDNAINIRPGTTQLIAQSAASRTMTWNIGLLTAATTGAVINRTAGGVLGFVEYGNGGTSVITLGAKTGMTSNAAIPWATYGNAPGQAIDFAMVDAGASNGIDRFSRALDEYNNDVTAWLANQDVSENGGSGFRNTLGGALTLNSLRFDANADSVVNLGGNTLTVSNATFGGFTGGSILVSSNVGASNKTITGGILTTANNGELIINHFGSGNLNVDAQIGAAGAAPSLVTVSGPGVTGADVLNNWAASSNGQVVLGADNSVAAKETKWYINGGVLSVGNENQLGKVDIAAATADAIYINGGALRWTGTGLSSLDNERYVMIGGNGGVIDVVEGDANLRIAGEIRTENNYAFVNGSAANHQGGDLIKMGVGTLTLNGESANNASFAGLLDIREGTLRIDGDNTATAGTQTITILGTNRSAQDGTVFRTGTNFEVQMGPAGGAVEWLTEEWMRFEGDNTIRLGIIGGTNRVFRFGGQLDLQGDITVDVASGMTVRFNQSSDGYMTGSGDITKIGDGVFELRENNVEWSGGLNIYQGTLRLISYARPAGMGTTPIMLGSLENQGVAVLDLFNEQAIPGQPNEVFQDINVTYNPLQTKRITFESFQGVGQDYYVHGNITMSDNLVLYGVMNAVYPGGHRMYGIFDGQFRDDTLNGRSGNLEIHVDDTNSGTVSNQQNSPGLTYFVLNNDNSQWTGDVKIGANQAWDQDEYAVLRVGHQLGLTAANDVYMNGASKLQVAGNNVTIGSLITNDIAASGASGTINGVANDGLGDFQGVTGSSAFIENSSTVAGTLTIMQTTPSTSESLWDVTFQDGTVNDHFIHPSFTGSSDGASLSVVKAGNGWATMSVDNHYTGTTTITAGTLQVGRNGLGDTGAVRAANVLGLILNNGAKLAGTGVVQGRSIISGEVDPGDGGGSQIGTLTFNGNVTFDSSAVSVFQIQRASFNAPDLLPVGSAGYNITSIATNYSTAFDDPVLSTQHDRMIITGAATLTGGAKFVVALDGYTPTAGDIFSLMSWASVVGAVNVGSSIRSGGEGGLDLDLPVLGGDFRWDVSQFNTAGFVGVTLIPEPSRMMLLLLGLLGLWMRRRRSRD